MDDPRRVPLGRWPGVGEKQPCMDIALITYWGLPEMTEDDQRLLSRCAPGG